MLWGFFCAPTWARTRDQKIMSLFVGTSLPDAKTFFLIC